MGSGTGSRPRVWTPARLVGIWLNNLTVEGIHTYHVGAADILVHNTGRDCGTGAAKSGDEFVNLASEARTTHILDG